MIERDEAEALVAGPFEQRDQLVAPFLGRLLDGAPQHGEVALRERDEMPERRLPDPVVVVGQRLQQQLAGLAGHAVGKELDRGGPDVGIRVVEGLGQRRRPLVEPGPADHADGRGPDDRRGVGLEHGVGDLDRPGVAGLAEHVEHGHPDRAGRVVEQLAQRG